MWPGLSFFVSCACGSVTGVECGTTKYNNWVIPTAIAGFAYSCGIPAFYMYLVYRYKERGRRGDKKVQKAFGWMCTSKCVFEQFRETQW